MVRIRLTVNQHFNHDLGGQMIDKGQKPVCFNKTLKVFHILFVFHPFQLSVYLLNGKIKHIKQIIKYLEANYISTHKHTVSAVFANASFGFETDITYLAWFHVQYKGSHCSIRLMFLGFVCSRTGSHDYEARMSLCCSQQFLLNLSLPQD